jgi:hypothetical protein
MCLSKRSLTVYRPLWNRWNSLLFELFHAKLLFLRYFAQGEQGEQLFLWSRQRGRNPRDKPRPMDGNKTPRRGAYIGKQVFPLFHRAKFNEFREVVWNRFMEQVPPRLFHWARSAGFGEFRCSRLTFELVSARRLCGRLREIRADNKPTFRYRISDFAHAGRRRIAVSAIGTVWDDRAASDAVVIGPPIDALTAVFLGVAEAG